MKLAPLVLSLGGFAVVGTILAAALPESPAAPAAEAPVLPARPAQTAQTAPPAKPMVVPMKPAPAPAAAGPSATATPAAAPAGPSQAELDQLVAPIALYPDQLLGQVLMAATYPADVAEAGRWVGAPAHRSLKGAALAAALHEQHWDPSVMALAAFPDLLEALCARLEWTRKLGAAFVAQRAEVMDAVQRLRQLAMAAGTLKSGGQCQCQVHAGAGIVTVAPAKPSVVHVPVYNPVVAYGAWPYPQNPPITFPLPPGYAMIGGVPMGYNSGVEIAAYGPLWGWSRVDWPGRAIIVDAARYAAIPNARAAFAGGVWRHETTHRPAPARAVAVLTPRPKHLEAHRHFAEHHAGRHHTVVATHHAPPPPPPWETAMSNYPAYGPGPGGPYPPMPPHVAMGGPYGYYYGPR